MCKDCLLDPKMDFIFKRIFGSENDTDILIRFLNAIFENKNESSSYDPIVEVQILNNEIPKKSIEDKYSILDIKAKTSTGEVINIEIQRKDEGNLLKRAIFYLSKIVAEQLESGEDYEEINRAVAIVITDFKTKFIDCPDFHNIYNYMHKINHELLTDLTELHFIELPKMETFDEDSVLELFLQFLRDPYDDVVQEKSAQINELSKAKQKLTRLSRDPKTREEYEAREKALKDRTSALNYAKAEGMAKGKAEGKAEGLAEGKAEGMAKGIVVGKAEGKSEGLAEGKAEGLVEGKAAGTLETKLENAKSLLDILDDVTIANKIGLDVSKVKRLRDEVEG